ncbi:MAG: hypothetical protein ABDK94_03285 [Atribacterota bacterium]
MGANGQGDENQLSFGAILETLLGIEGRSGEERNVLLWIAEFLQECDFRHLYWQEYQLGKWNLYARRGCSPFLFASHVDVQYMGRKPGFFIAMGSSLGQVPLMLAGKLLLYCTH